MTCTLCGRWAPPDPETGYDADAICKTCKADGWMETSDGKLVRDYEINPLQLEWEQLQGELRRIRGRLAEIKRAMVHQERPCEVCGTTFRDARLARKHCSQACTLRAYALRRRSPERVRQLLAKATRDSDL